MDSGRSARVGVAFVILGFSLLGVLPPILAAVRQRRGGGYDDTKHGGTSALMLRVKAFAAGVMLSLSVVHVVYDTFATLSELETSDRYPLYAGYPLGGPFIVLGILGCAPACCALRAVRAGRSKSAWARAHGLGMWARARVDTASFAHVQRADARAACAVRPRSMFFLEQGALDYITRLEAQATPEAAARGDVEAATGDGVTPKELEHAAPSSGEHAHAHLNMLNTLQAAHTHTKFCASGAVDAAAPAAELACGGCEHEHTHLNLLDAVQAAHTHTHLCAGGGASGGKGAALALRTPAQQMALCVSLELSIVVHSVIIGCACSASVAVPNILLTLHFPCSLACSFELGLNPDNSTLVGLVVVLCFHQFFEGLGLGSYIGHMAG